MAYPSDLPTVTVRHRIVGTDGTPARGGGRVTAVLTGRLWTGQGSVVPTQYTATVQEDGTYELELPPVDHPDIVAGRGEAYLVTEPAATIDTRRPGRVATEQFHVAPTTDMVGQTVDVSDVLVNKPKPGGGVERVTITGPATDESLAGIIADPSTQTAATLKDTIAAEADAPARAAAVDELSRVPEVADAAATRAVAVAADPAIATALDTPGSETAKRVYRPGELVDSAAKYGASPTATAAVNATAINTALATGRPVLLPGGPGTTYQVGKINLTNGGQLLGNGATLRATGTDFLHFTGLSGFTIDGLLLDANDVADTALRLTDCHDFTIGTIKAINARSRGVQFEGCTGWHADSITADDNGHPDGPTVGSGVYLTNHGTQGNTGFTIGTLRGNANGHGPGLDGQALHTNGTCRGSISQIHATNNTRYGVKFQHTGGHVNVGQIYAVGNQRNVSTPGCNGLTVGTLYSKDASNIGVWLDSNVTGAARNITIGQAIIEDSGSFGLEAVEDVEDITVGTLIVKRSGKVSGGFLGIGLDIKGGHRIRFGRVIIEDAGKPEDPAAMALRVVVSKSTDVHLEDVYLRDTRTGAERALRPAHILNATWPNISIGTLVARNFQSAISSGVNSDVAPRYDSDGRRTRNRGTATIPSGSTSVVVAHGLPEAPTRVLVTGSHPETGSVWALGYFSSEFTIRVPTAVTADRTVHWQAEY